MVDMLERKKLIDYLPPFTRQFGEIKEVMETENKQFDVLNENIQKVLDNAFIADCDEYGIKKYESLLNIVPVPEDTLESRKSRVLLRWNEYVPYTYRVLIRRVNAYCGENNYRVNYEPENYQIFLQTSLEMFGQVQELEEMLDRILPENIYYRTENTIRAETGNTLYTGGGVVYCERIAIMD